MIRSLNIAFPRRSCSSVSVSPFVPTTVLSQQFRFQSTTMTKMPLRRALGQFKRIGAHPDLVSSVDPERAGENGRNLIELEQLLDARRTPAARAAMRSRGEPREVNLRFWIKTTTSDAATGKAPDQRLEQLQKHSKAESDPLDAARHLRLVEIELTPQDSDSVVHKQLSDLFSQAGLPTDMAFTLHDGEGSHADEQEEAKLSSKLSKALNKLHAKIMNPHSSMAELYVRLDAATDILRSRGVVVALRDETRRSSYLLTMPEAPSTGSSMTNPSRPVEPGGSTSSRSVLDLDYEQRRFLAQRSFEPFDLRYLNSDTVAEAIVDRAEQLAGWYLRNQGTTLRPGVCYLFEVSNNQRFPRLTGDGCISLPLVTPHLWQDFLSGLSQPQWSAVVNAQEAWRSHRAPLLKQRQSQLARLADMVHYHSMDLYCGPGSMNDAWVNKFILGFMKEEAAVRKTVDKYAAELKDKTLKGRGLIECLPPPPPKPQQDAKKQEQQQQQQPPKKSTSSPPYRLCADGTIQLETENTTPIGLLKFLRASNKTASDSIRRYSAVTSHLEHFGHASRVRLAVHHDWRRSDDRNMNKKLEKCLESLRQSKTALTAFSQQGGREVMVVIVDEEPHGTSEAGAGILPLHWNFTPSDLSSRLRLMR